MNSLCRTQVKWIRRRFFTVSVSRGVSDSFSSSYISNGREELWKCFERHTDNAKWNKFSWLLLRQVSGNSDHWKMLSKRKIPLNHWVHLRYRRQGCKDRNRQHRRPAWAFSQDAIPEDSGRPAVASVPCSRISSLWLCCADSLNAVWLAAEGGTARHSGKSTPGRRPTRVLRSPIEVPVASPASCRYTAQVTIA